MQIQLINAIYCTNKYKYNTINNTIQLNIYI